MLEAFKRFANKEYQIDHWASIQRDKARKKPRVTAGLIFKNCVFGVTLGIRSVLELDQKGRTAVSRQLLQSCRVIAGGSDTTALRALSAWQIQPLRKALYNNHLKLRQQGNATTKLSTGKKVRLSVVDGTCTGGHWFSALAFAGSIPHALDVEPYKGRGHELTSSRNLLKRAVKQLGKGFATHTLYDGLMAVKADFWRARHYWGTHLLVKTSEETLEIVQSSKGVWLKLSSEDLKRAGIEVISGVDSQEALRFKVYAQGNIPWIGSTLKFNVAWVKETHLKGKHQGKTFDFWVITTDQTLTAAELREIAHNRWTIENNQFKELSEQVGSKRAYIKNAQAKQAFLMMGLLGLSLLKAFKAYLESFKEWRDCAVKKTKKIVAQVILFGLPYEMQLNHSPP